MSSHWLPNYTSTTPYVPSTSNVNSTGDVSNSPEVSGPSGVGASSKASDLQTVTTSTYTASAPSTPTVTGEVQTATGEVPTATGEVPTVMTSAAPDSGADHWKRTTPEESTTDPVSGAPINQYEDYNGTVFYVIDGKAYLDSSGTIPYDPMINWKRSGSTTGSGNVPGASGASGQFTGWVDPNGNLTGTGEETGTPSVDPNDPDYWRSQRGYETNPDYSDTPSYVYTVNFGETLSGIARKLLGSSATTSEVYDFVKQLVEWNGISDPDKIYAGQLITYHLPGDGTPQTPTTDAPDSGADHWERTTPEESTTDPVSGAPVNQYEDYNGTVFYVIDGKAYLDSSGTIPYDPMINWNRSGSTNGTGNVPGASGASGQFTGWVDPNGNLTGTGEVTGTPSVDPNDPDYWRSQRGYTVDQDYIDVGPEKPTTHTVKSGETLWGIAKKYLPQGASNADIQNYVNELVRKNNITHPRLYIFPGDVITL